MVSSCRALAPPQAGPAKMRVARTLLVTGALFALPAPTLDAQPTTTPLEPLTSWRLRSGVRLRLRTSITWAPTCVTWEVSGASHVRTTGGLLT